MDSLRITLLLVGVVCIALIFFWERIKQRKRETRYERWGGVSEEGRETRIVGNRSGDPETDATLVATAYKHDEPVVEDIREESSISEQEEAMEWREAVETSLDEQGLDLETDPEAEQYDPVPNLTSELEALEEIISGEDETSEQMEIGDFNVPTREDEAPIQKSVAETAPEPIAERIIALHILAAEGSAFAGPDILNVLMQSGMQYGDMSIFHRLDDQGKPIFSLANAIEPGVFDMSGMDELTTPALLMIMTLPNSCPPLDAYDMMLETARSISDSLNGRLCDDKRSVLTTQAIEELRRELVMPV